MSTTPHLDDELLSAHLDGEAAEAAAHLVDCAECRGRLEGLRAAARVVGTATAPPSAEAIDAAVARALGDGRRTTPRPVLVALAAAAALVLGVVGVGVLDDGGGDDADVTALSDPQGGKGADGGEGLAAGAMGADTVTDAGDLGELDDARVLADRVRSTVEPPPTTISGTGEAATAQDEAVIRPTGRSSAAPMLSQSKATAEDPYCEQTVAKTYAEGLGPLVYRATLRWDGTQAVAVAYRLAEPQGELDHRVYVLAVSGCRLLVAQTV